MSWCSVQNLDGELIPVGTGEELAVQTAVVSPAALNANASHGLVSVKSNAVLVTLDGSDPVDGGRGLLLAANSLKVFAKETIAKMKLIRAAGANGVVHIQGMAARG